MTCDSGVKNPVTSLKIVCYCWRMFKQKINENPFPGNKSINICVLMTASDNVYWLNLRSQNRKLGLQTTKIIIIIIIIHSSNICSLAKIKIPKGFIAIFYVFILISKTPYGWAESTKINNLSLKKFDRILYDYYIFVHTLQMVISYIIILSFFINTWIIKVQT